MNEHFNVPQFITEYYSLDFREKCKISDDEEFLRNAIRVVYA